MEEYKVVKIGIISDTHNLLRKEVLEALQGCELILLDTPAVYGSALEAVWLTGEEPEEGFRSRFIDTFNRHPSKRAAW